MKGLAGRKNRSDPRQHRALLKDYDEFFRDENRHIRKFVASANDAKHITINEVVNSFMPNHHCHFLLKIDIEGAEYGILNDICGISRRLVGLVMEFHDVAKRINEIEAFMARLPLNLCHVHCNNYGKIGDRGLPEAHRVVIHSLQDMRHASRRASPLLGQKQLTASSGNSNCFRVDLE